MSTPEVLTRVENGRRPAILAVEDDPSLRRLLHAILDETFSVTDAPDGRSAIGLASRQRPDLVLLDMGLPDIGGIDVLHALRSEPRTMTVPVVIVTGQADLDERVRGLDAGADDYVVKPFGPEELVARIRAHLRGRQAWLQEATTDWAIRAAVSDNLGRLSAQATPGWAATAICNELCQIAGISDAAVIALAEPHEPMVVGASAVPVPHTGQPLSASVVPDLLARVTNGPWTVTNRHPLALELFGRADAPMACAPLRRGHDVIGVLALAAAPEAVDPGRCLSVAADFAGIAAALLAPALERLGMFTDLEAALRDTLARADLEMAFQPILDLESGSPVGYEALSRFELGMPPDQVFTYAHRLDLGLQLEVLAVRSAIARAQRLDAGYLAVNVSPRVVVERSDLVDLLGDAGRPIVVEITEREPIEDYLAVTAALERLGPAVRVAVDDAGSGYASLSHVLALQPSIVKLDRALVDGIDADSGRQSLLRSLHRFASDTGTTLVAEGVETTAQLDALVACGIGYAQGYLLGKPEALAA